MPNMTTQTDGFAVLLPTSHSWRPVSIAPRLVVGSACVPGHVDAPEVAPQHCIFECVGDTACVVDAGPGTTRVGGLDASRRPLPVEAGSVVRLGRVPLVVVQQRRDEAGMWYGIGDMGSWSAIMLPILAQLALVAPAQCPVLIRGETGTGKEWAARTLHERSPRAHRPLVAVNCGALHGDLLLAELFGAERGAYTGCTERRKGAFERADGGTLFLDELGELPAAAQAALLRALESGEIQVLGGPTRKVDVRLVCATHRDLVALVSQGRFRLDLLHRINVAEVQLPPLRHRKADIAGLAQHWWPDGSLSAAVLGALAGYSFPGNLRELRNVLQRLQLGARFGTPDLGDLRAVLGPVPLLAGQVGFDPLWAPDLDQLRATGVPAQQAWRASGLSRATFYRRWREAKQAA